MVTIRQDFEGNGRNSDETNDDDDGTKALLRTVVASTKSPTTTIESIKASATSTPLGVLSLNTRKARRHHPRSVRTINFYPITYKM